MNHIDVIGIDPGSRYTGWGIVRECSGSFVLISCGVINTLSVQRNKEEQLSGFSQRLAMIYTDLALILSQYRPEAAAIEQVFTAFNVSTALKLGQARGVAVAACASFGLKVHDYEPTLVKKSLVGVGRAEKEQVAFMVKRLLNIRDANWKLDTTDALAVAICHLSQRRFAALTKKY